MGTRLETHRKSERRRKTLAILRFTLLKCQEFRSAIQFRHVWGMALVSNDEENDFYLFKARLKEACHNLEQNKKLWRVPVRLLCDDEILCAQLISYGIHDIDQLGFSRSKHVWRLIADQGNAQGILLSFARRYPPEGNKIRFVAYRYRSSLREKTIQVLKEARFRCHTFLREGRHSHQSDLRLLEEKDRESVIHLCERINLALTDLKACKKQFRVPIRLLIPHEELCLWLSKRGIYDVDQLGGRKDPLLWRSLNPEREKGPQVLLSFFRRVMNDKRRSRVLEIVAQKAA